MKRFFMYLCLSIYLTACAFPSGLNPTATPLPTLTNTATLTPSPLPTETPLPTNTPTVTPLPSPTPTPVGFYTTSSGASLVIPNGWSVGADQQNSFTMMDTDDYIFLIIDCENNETVANLPFENQVNRYAFTFSQMFKNYSRVSTDSITLANDITAQRALMAGKAVIQGKTLEMDFNLAIITQSPKVFYISILGEKKALESHKSSISKLYKSISLTSSTTYGVERSKTLYMLGGIAEANDLDPATQTHAASSYAGHIFSGLVRLSPQLQIEPDLAESWTVSPDGIVYTFHMRKGLLFQSGYKLNAWDVKYSWERATAPKTGSTTAKTYLGDIVGVNEKIDGKANDISGVKVVDDLTLEVTLDGPKPYFLAKLTYPVSFVIDKSDVALDDTKWMFHPNASGPFAIKEYREGDVLVFERNPNYYAPAKLNSIVYLLQRSGTSLSYYEAGDVDIIYLGIDDAKEIQKPEHPLHDQLQTTSQMCTDMLKFNNSRPPMDDPKVREAFTRAIDRAQLVEQFSDNLDPVAQSILPPGMPGYSQDLAAASFDVEAAKAALAESKYATNMPKVVLSLQSASTQISPYFEAILSMWRENLGIDVKVELLSPDDFIKTVRKNPGHIVSLSWCADYPDPENFLDIMFHTGNDFNVSNYSNPEIDTLLDQARVELDTTRRLDLYKQAEKALLDDFSVIPLLTTSSFALVKPSVKGFTLSPMFYPFVHLVWLEEPAP